VIESFVSDLAAVARAIRSEPNALSFVAFDLLDLESKDLRGKTLLERRLRLAELVKGNPKPISARASMAAPTSPNSQSSKEGPPAGRCMPGCK
jgi:ATP-dependent DNA ligase